MIKILLSVFVGGGLGSLSRYGVGLFTARYAATVFPIATLSVNILGSFLIGLLWGSPFIAEKPVWTHLLIVGFCGGFTTFSAFSWENFSLIKQGEIMTAILYIAASFIFCLLATWGGYALARTVSN